MEGPPPYTILDFGCGPGRDLKTLAALGHTAIGLDGSAAFVAMARADTGCEAWQQDFLALYLPRQRAHAGPRVPEFHVTRAGDGGAMGIPILMEEKPRRLIIKTGIE